jgi:hypothetical protein
MTEEQFVRLIAALGAIDRSLVLIAMQLIALTLMTGCVAFK